MQTVRATTRCTGRVPAARAGELNTLGLLGINMTTAARVVLEDCRGALKELDGSSGPEWRRRCVTCLTLLRAVGHVLEKVDGAASVHAGAAVAKRFSALKASKPEPLIFWEFIEKSRNLVLKEYQLCAGQSVCVDLGGRHIRTSSEEPMTVDQAVIELSYPIHEGCFAGKDQRHVIGEAIAWWSGYLDTVDASARAEQA